MYLLDTNTVIDLFKNRGRVAERVLATPPAQIGLSSIVLPELLVGAEESRRPVVHRRESATFARLAVLMYFGAEEARAAARLRANLEKEGRGIGPYDTLIAATALASGATLVTHNTREYGRVSGIRVEDWF